MHVKIDLCADNILILHPGLFNRMEDKGEVKCIKFSLGNKILAVQRTLKSVVSTVFYLYCSQRSYIEVLFKTFIFVFLRISKSSFLIIHTWNSPMSARYP